MSPTPFDGDEGSRRASPGARWRRLGERLALLADFRQHWWDFLTAFEERRGLRIKIYLSVVLVVGLSASAVLFYPHWRETRAISVARQWTAVGKLERAGPAVEAALREAPDRAEAWEVASDYAQRSGQLVRAAEYARRAAQLTPGQTEPRLRWAAQALAAGKNDSAAEALAPLPVTASAWAQRLTGELARRRGDLGAARAAFEAAVRLGGASAENELPLGIVLLASEQPAEQARGSELLEKWSADPVVGADAARALLENAVVRDRREAMVRWAEALRKHPAHTRADLLNVLLALGRADRGRFQMVLKEVEASYASDPTATAELLTWLTGNQWLAEARAWVAVLPAETKSAPPVVSQIAELMRVGRDWARLKQLTDAGDWAEKLDFLRQAYAALAARELGDTERAATLWRGLRGSAEIRGGQGFFLAGVLYAWGWRDEAVELWWLGAEQGGLAVQALGSLARHYQVTGDAAGSLRVFRRLHGLRANDDAVANNLVYFEALVGQPTRATRELAKTIFERHTDDVRFRSTYAFVLWRQDAAAEALALLEPVAEELKWEPALAFTYGLILAANGRAAEARMVLERVNLSSLTPPERALLNAARAR